MLITILIVAMVLLPAVLSQTVEYPESLKDHYRDQNSIFWDIRQISISPIFDEPETSRVELYFQKPDRLFILSPEKQIYTANDTIWTYLVNHKQIQLVVGGQVFNPFDFLDSSQTYYEVISAGDNNVALKSMDQTMEPEGLEIYFNETGAITSVEYLDVNENKVKFELIDESFEKSIPVDIFINAKPEGVEIINISD
ncbi:MAG: outer membrane lipoprotein carrier protein LolA [candidate division Zixibacteria bacterium]|nr:outer membrane lipoprotein carrier protein LolA [candidate division Zixibacteria bacterium]